jgi:hypothetical protein
MHACEGSHVYANMPILNSPQFSCLKSERRQSNYWSVTHLQLWCVGAKTKGKSVTYNFLRSSRLYRRDEQSNLANGYLLASWDSGQVLSLFSNSPLLLHLWKCSVDQLSECSQTNRGRTTRRGRSNHICFLYQARSRISQYLTGTIWRSLSLFLSIQERWMETGGRINFGLLVWIRLSQSMQTRESRGSWSPENHTFHLVIGSTHHHRSFFLWLILWAGSSKQQFRVEWGFAVKGLSSNPAPCTELDLLFSEYLLCSFVSFSSLLRPDTC